MSSEDLVKCLSNTRIASASWIMDLGIRGVRRSFCIDYSLMSMVSQKFRRIIFIYPPESCVSNIYEHVGGRYLTIDQNISARETLSMIIESCDDARSVVASDKCMRRFSRFRYFMLMSPSKTEELCSEARSAAILCDAIFEGSLDDVAIYNYSRAYLIYNIGGSDTQDKRLRSVLSSDPGVVEGLSRLCD